MRRGPPASGTLFGHRQALTTTGRRRGRAVRVRPVGRERWLRTEPRGDHTPAPANALRRCAQKTPNDCRRSLAARRKRQALGDRVPARGGSWSLRRGPEKCASPNSAEPTARPSRASSPALLSAACAPAISEATCGSSRSASTVRRVAPSATASLPCAWWIASAAQLSPWSAPCRLTTASHVASMNWNRPEALLWRACAVGLSALSRCAWPSS